jgi:hypothetical protein
MALLNRSTVLMANLLEKPEDFYGQIKRYTASVAASITFGQRGATPDDFWARVGCSIKRQHP